MASAGFREATYEGGRLASAIANHVWRAMWGIHNGRGLPKTPSGTVYILIALFSIFALWRHAGEGALSVVATGILLGFMLSSFPLNVAMGYLCISIGVDASYLLFAQYLDAPLLWPAWEAGAFVMLLINVKRANTQDSQ